jgi:hypothetical protein
LSQGCWLLLQGKFLVENVSDGIIIGNQTLVLQKIRREDAGLYTCVASNQGPILQNYIFGRKRDRFKKTHFRPKTGIDLTNSISAESFTDRFSSSETYQVVSNLIGVSSGHWQGDQLSFRKIAQNVAQPIFCQNYCKTFIISSFIKKQDTAFYVNVTKTILS